MKKFLFYFLAVFLFVAGVTPASASFLKTKPSENSEVIAKPETAGLSGLSIEQILSLTPKNFEKVTGKKLSFKDKLGLKLVQRSMKRELKKNGTLDLNTYFEQDMPRFNVGGFALGLFLGLIGVALAHIFSNSKSFRRSSWYGVGVLIIILLIVSAAGGNK